jgi:hypothetical protein
MRTRLHSNAIDAVAVLVLIASTATVTVLICHF